MNTTEKDVMISNLEFHLEPFEYSNDAHNNADILTITNAPSNYGSDRLTKISNCLRTDHLNHEEKDSLIQICHEYNHIFHLESDTLSCTDLITHKIPTTSDIPVNVKTYRYPEVHKTEVEKQIQQMLEQEIIQPSSSPWNSPVWVVPKKSLESGQKKWRLVVDYRKLNDISIGDSYPLPNITEILDQLGHSKYFTTLDLTSGFHQVKVHPEDAPKTGFSVPSGHYQFNRMPFGLLMLRLPSKG